MDIQDGPLKHEGDVTVYAQAMTNGDSVKSLNQEMKTMQEAKKAPQNDDNEDFLIPHLAQNFLK